MWQTQPHEALALDQSEHAERPVQDTVSGVKDPEPRNSSDGNRCNPRKQDEKANQLLAAKIFLQHERESIAENQNDHLGKEREDKRVLQGRLKLRCVDDAGEVSQANEAQCPATRGGVADAVIESHEERQSDQQHEV